MVAFPATDFTACGNILKNQRVEAHKCHFYPEYFLWWGLLVANLQIPIMDFLWHLSREQGTPLEEPRRYWLVFLVENAFSPLSV